MKAVAAVVATLVGFACWLAHHYQMRWTIGL